jgi:prefoldin subunit 2
MKGEYQQIYKVYMDLDDEKKEHELVIEATKELESNRKCWRMIGGVLVERTLGEVLPALK